MSLSNLQSAMVPEVLISSSVSVERRASSRVSFRISIDHLARRGPAEVLLQRAPLRLERLEDVGDEHLVLPLGVGHHEVLALGAGVVLRDVAGGLREREVVEAPVGSRLFSSSATDSGVALLVEADEPGHRLDRAVVRPLAARSGSMSFSAPATSSSSSAVTDAAETCPPREEPALDGAPVAPSSERDEQRTRSHFTSSS